jgi:hypothetical protein
LVKVETKRGYKRKKVKRERWGIEDRERGG